MISAKDGADNVTRYRYNELGAMLSKQDPSVSYTGEDGVKVTNFTPITQYYVDAVGQTIAILWLWPYQFPSLRPGYGGGCCGIMR